MQQEQAPEKGTKKPTWRASCDGRPEDGIYSPHRHQESKPETPFTPPKIRSSPSNLPTFQPSILPILPPLLQKPPLQLRRRHQARLLLPKPPVPVLCDESVHRVPHHPWQHHRHIAHRPGEAQPPRHPQRRRALAPCPAVLHQHKAVQARRVQPVCLHQRLPCRRLQRRKAEHPARIPFDDETHRPRAQVAHTVEEDDGGRLAQG